MQPTDVARQAYAAFGTGDMLTLGELLSPDTVWHINDVKPVNGDYHGVDGVFGFFGSLLEPPAGAPSSSTSASTWVTTVTPRCSSTRRLNTTARRRRSPRERRRLAGADYADRRLRHG